MAHPRRTRQEPSIGNDAHPRPGPGRSLRTGATCDKMNAVFGCLEIFHNRQRRHSSLGILTPFDDEIRYVATA